MRSSQEQNVEMNFKLLLTYVIRRWNENKAITTLPPHEHIALKCFSIEQG